MPLYGDYAGIADTVKVVGKQVLVFPDRTEDGGIVETYAGMKKRLGKGTDMEEKSGRGQGMGMGRRTQKGQGRMMIGRGFKREAKAEGILHQSINHRYGA